MIRKFLLITPLVFGLSACGLSIGSNSPKDFGVGRIVDNIQAARGRNQPKQEKQAGLTRDALNKINRELIKVQLTKYGTTGVFTKVADRSNNQTFQSTAKQSITLQDGALRMTRGLPFDLLETDLRNDQDRKYRFLNAANNLTEVTVSCDRQSVGSDPIEIVERSYNTTLIEETCRGSGTAFKNRYWVQGNTIWKSQQWIGPQHGFAIIEKLN
ncbi:MAG: YjbF family lipoprotein [Pseudomonadota bacterium]